MFTKCTTYIAWQRYGSRYLVFIVRDIYKSIYLIDGIGEQFYFGLYIVPTDLVSVFLDVGNLQITYTDLPTGFS